MPLGLDADPNPLPPSPQERLWLALLTELEPPSARHALLWDRVFQRSLPRYVTWRHSLWTGAVSAGTSVASCSSVAGGDEAACSSAVDSVAARRGGAAAAQLCVLRGETHLSFVEPRAGGQVVEVHMPEERVAADTGARWDKSATAAAPCGTEVVARLCDMQGAMPRAGEQVLELHVP